MRALNWLWVSVVCAGCAPAVSPFTVTKPSCPTAVESNTGIRWIAPLSPEDVTRSRPWCEAVGPAVVRAAPEVARAHAGSVLVVSWNVARGDGQVPALVHRLVDDERRAQRPDPDLVLLLQETVHGTSAGRRQDVVSLATDLRMDVVYIPSMRTQDGDRGNAILSTLPLRDVTAIELPFVRQRRVAVAAAFESAGVRFTVVSVHLDTRQPFLRGSIFSAAFARGRQAAALAEEASSMTAMGPVIVAGDFNTFSGAGEPAIRVMEQYFSRVACGSSITHGWRWPLDHFFTSDVSMVSECSRSDERYGSDHHPLVARVARDYAAPDNASARRPSPISARSFHASAIQ